VDRGNSLDGFQLHEQPPIDDDVGPKPFFEPHPFVDDWDRHLACDLTSAHSEFMGEHRLIDALE
jgi:hypothetical protein